MDFKNLEELITLNPMFNSNHVVSSGEWILLWVLLSGVIFIASLSVFLTYTHISIFGSDRYHEDSVKKSKKLAGVWGMIFLVIAAFFGLGIHQLIDFKINEDKMNEALYQNFKEKYKIQNVKFVEDSSIHEFVSKKGLGTETSFGTFDVILESGIVLKNQTISMDNSTGEPFMITETIKETDTLRSAS